MLSIFQELRSESFMQVSGLRPRASHSPPSASVLQRPHCPNLVSVHFQEFKLFNLLELALPLITPALQDQLSDWDPLRQPDQAVSFLLQWRPLLLDDDMSTQSTALFDALAEQLVVRKIQTCLTNEWNVQDARPCIALVEGLKGIENGIQRRQTLISQPSIDNLLDTIIFPKLKRAVEQWRADDRENQAGEWLSPWLPHLKAELASLMPSVRRKLSQSLDAWRPEHNAEQLALLKPWLAIFDEKTLDSLSTQIASRLALQLREIEINPRNQTGLPTLRSILAFGDMLPPIHMTSLLQGELFPRWKAVLYNWIRQSDSTANADIVKWYRQWKSLLFKCVPSNPQLNAEFSHGLELMEKGRTLSADAFEQLAPDLDGPSSYPQALRLLKELAHEEAAAAATAAAGVEEKSWGAHKQSKQRASAIDGLDSFKEVVASFAEEHGVPFMPKQRQYSGFQVYSFGGASIYLDKDVCFVESSGTQWHAIGLSDLLEYGTSKKAGKK